ncbi:PAAR domain-containing protein [Oxalobacteraceae bacterium OM1]|nr:PAAR domain-containing protein [Oxalobacteraceae bacterium OM1]
MRRVIRLGDPTTHGGHVVQATERYTMDGVPVARMGDHCTCPIPGHAGCVIVEGDPDWTIDGKPVALEGHLTSCGAALISTFGRLERSRESVGSMGMSQGSAVTLEREHPATHSEVASDPLEYDDHYILLCGESHKPLAHIEYAVQRADGTIEHGVTDESGRTHLLVTAAEQEHISIFVEG